MKPASVRHWLLRDELPSQTVLDSLAEGLAVSPLTGRLLALRGISGQESGHAFLHPRLADLPDPALLPDMETACVRLEAALRKGEKIAVHGDYDVDGISGCCLLVEALRSFGGQVEYHIPLRLVDGYGLSREALQRAAEHGCRVVVSVDCGVSAFAESDFAKSIGLDLVVTDHHQPAEQLPDCYALINPHLAGCPFPWPELSGVGVAFFLMLGLRRRLRNNGYFQGRPEPDLRMVLDLVALGTIADIVPLDGVNRILVRTGLQLLEQSQRPGMVALKKVAQVTQVSSGIVGYRLAPRLNAAGRLEDASLGVRLLLGGDDEELLPLAEYLDTCNNERRQLEDRTLAQAVAMVEADLPAEQYSIVLASEDWHSGVIGIVASRLVERYHRPTILIALENGQGKGSARSIGACHLFASLNQCADFLSGYGGHAMAAGLSIAEELLPDFVLRFEEVVRQVLTTDDLLPHMKHDGEIALAEIDLPLLQEFELLNPYGAGNPQPVFMSRNCEICQLRVLADKHLKFRVEQQGYGIDAIAFAMADRYDEFCGPADLLFKPQINEWRGVQTVQLQVIDVKKSQNG